MTGITFPDLQCTGDKSRHKCAPQGGQRTVCELHFLAPRMTGVIRTRHLLTHCVTIIRGFGLKAYLSCVWTVLRHPGRKSTFLGTIY